MPYLKFSPKISIRYFGWRLYELSEFLEKYVKDSARKEFIERLLFSNTIHAQPIRDLLIFTPSGSKLFKEISQNNQKIIEELRCLLFICTVSSSNTGKWTAHTMVTSENLNLVYQNFHFSKLWTAYSSGKLVNITDGGYEIGEISFEKPPYVLRREASFDSTFFSELKSVKKNNSVLFRRIIRSIQAFMQGFYNSDDLSMESRVLELTRAFEILFDLPMDKQREWLKNSVKKYCQSRAEREYSYKYECHKTRKKTKGSMHEIWADRFYTLRNHIIHGNRLAQSEFKFKGQPHWYIALLFFIVAIKQLINDAKRKRYFYDIIRYQDKSFSIDNQIKEKILDKLSLSHRAQMD